jgi:RNA recognition motif-containing protein
MIPIYFTRAVVPAAYLRMAKLIISAHASNHNRSNLPPTAMRLHGSRLFVGGLAPGTSDADLRGYFRRYGEVGQIWLPRPNSLAACRPRVFAFVQFLNPNAACRALTDAHHVINGRQVYDRLYVAGRPAGTHIVVVSFDLFHLFVFLVYTY